MKRKLLALVLMVMCLLTFFATTAAAAVSPNEAIMPCYENVINVIPEFKLNSAGELCVKVAYYGNSTTFAQAKITVEIEKRFLGLFWRTVDIGYTDNLWVQYSTSCNGVFSNTFASDGKGTYRATIQLEFFGKNGVTDVIERTIECAYD